MTDHGYGVEAPGGREWRKPGARGPKLWLAGETLYLDEDGVMWSLYLGEPFRCPESHEPACRDALREARKRWETERHALTGIWTMATAAHVALRRTTNDHAKTVEG